MTQKNLAPDLERLSIDVESLLKRRSHNLALSFLLPRTPADPRVVVDLIATELGTDAAEILVDYVFELVMETGKPDPWIRVVGPARDRGVRSTAVAHFPIH